MTDSPENIQKAKDILTAYCQQQGFQFNNESSTDQVKFWSKYLSKNVLFSVGIGTGGYAMNLIILGPQQTVFTNNQSLPWFAFDLEMSKLALWSMMHDTIYPVFDKMLGLEIHPK